MNPPQAVDFFMKLNPLATMSKGRENAGVARNAETGQHFALRLQRAKA